MIENLYIQLFTHGDYIDKDGNKQGLPGGTPACKDNAKNSLEFAAKFAQKKLAAQTQKDYDKVGKIERIIGYAAQDFTEANPSIQLTIPDKYYSTLLFTLLSTISNLYANNSKYISCSVGLNGSINFDFTKLRDLSTTLLHQIKENINKLKAGMPVKQHYLLDKYILVDITGSANWLEENLVEKLFKNRDDYGIDVAVSNHLPKTLEKLITRPGKNYVSEAMDQLVYYRAGMQYFTGRTIRCNPTVFPFAVYPLVKTADSSEEKKLLSELTSSINFSDQNYVEPSNGLLRVPQIAFFRHKQYKHLSQLNPLDTDSSKSFLFTLNNLIRMYLQCNVEDSLFKIYPPLVETLMNSAGAYEITQHQAYPDIHQIEGKSHEGARMMEDHKNIPLPPDGSVIFASNAAAIYYMLTEISQIGNVQKKKFAYESLAEIPDGVKEKMKANLPYFSKILQNYHDRVEIIYKLFNNSKMRENSQRPGTGVTALLTIKKPTAPPHITNLVNLNVVDGNVNMSAAQYSSYISKMMSKMMDISLTLKKCADGVYKELNDKPYYLLETSKDSITEYKNRNTNMPFLLTSNILASLDVYDPNTDSYNMAPTYMHDALNSKTHLLLPVRELGSPVFKFNNGAKVLMAMDNNEPTLDHMPGAKEIYNHYSTHASNNKLPVNDYTDTLVKMLKLTRFLANNSVYDRLYPNNDGIISVDKYDEKADETAPTASTNLKFRSIPDSKNVTSKTDLRSNETKKYLSHYPVLAMARSLTEVLESMDTVSIRSSKEKIAELMGEIHSHIDGSERKAFRTANIIDMNIVPINVHAFMREVPFVNLLNYSYTFDRMVHDFINPLYTRNHVGSGQIIMKPNDAISSTREMFVKLLVYPYADLEKKTGTEYFALLASLFNGNDGLNLGRPRYLSDQLWHKALLTSSAQLVSRDGSTAAIESGPAAYEAIRSVINYGYPNSNTATHLTARDMTYGFYQKLTETLTTTFVADPTKKDAGKYIDILVNSDASYKPENDLANSTAYTHFNQLTMDEVAAEINKFAPTNVQATITKLNTDMKQELANSIRDITEISVKSGGGGTAKDSMLGLLFKAGRKRTSGGTDTVGELHTKLNVEVTALANNVKFKEFYNKTIGAGAGAITTGYDGSKLTNKKMDAAGNVSVIDDFSINKMAVEVLGLMDKFLDQLYTAKKYPVYKQFLLDILLVFITKNTSLLVQSNAKEVATYYSSEYINKASTLSYVEKTLLKLAIANASNFGNVDHDGTTTDIVSLLSIGTDKLLEELVSEARKNVEVAGNKPYLHLASNPNVVSGLKVLRPAKEDQPPSWMNASDKPMVPADVLYCAEVGKMRFDTKLVRNLTWMVQLQRLMRVVLTRHLSRFSSPVVSGLSIANPMITEFNGNDAYNRNEYNGARKFY